MLGWLLPFLPVPFYAWIYLQGDALHHRAALFLIVFLAAQAAYVLCLVVLSRRRFSLIAVAASAVISGFLLVPHNPTISTDIYRYIWDGRVTDSGLNVYLHRPSDLSELQKIDDLYQRMNYRDEYTIYPPFAQWLFYVAHWLYSQLGVWAAKVFFGLPFLGIGFILWRLLAQSQLPGPRRDWFMLAYALNPLLIFELFGSGHLDGWAILCIVASYYCYTKKMLQPAVLCIVAASLIKLWPIILIPALFITLNRGFTLPKIIKNALLTCVSAGLLLSLAYFPFVRDSWFAITRLQSWGATMSFNGIYSFLLGALQAPPAFVQITSLLLLVSVTIVAAFKKKLLAAWILTIITLLALAPVFYPWYGLVLLPLAVLAKKSHFIYALAGLYGIVSLTYIQQIDDWPAWSLVSKSALLGGIIIIEALLMLGMLVCLWRRDGSR